MITDSIDFHPIDSSCCNASMMVLSIGSIMGLNYFMSSLFCIEVKNEEVAFNAETLTQMSASFKFV